MVIELFANPKKKDKTQNGGSIDAAIPLSSLGSTDIFGLSTPYDAIIEREAWAHFYFTIQKTSEPLPDSLWLSVSKTTDNADDIEIIIDPAVYEADVDKAAAIGLSELEIDISNIADVSISESFWLRRTARNTLETTPSSLVITLKFNTK